MMIRVGEGGINICPELEFVELKNLQNAWFLNSVNSPNSLKSRFRQNSLYQTCYLKI
jgi:hypothetical protein